MAGPVLLSAATAAASLAVGTWAVAAVAFLGAAGFAYWIPRSGSPARLTVVTLAVLEGGRLEIGSEREPVPAAVQAENSPHREPAGRSR